MKTLVIGASENSDRYSFKAIERLRAHGHEVIAFGPKSGKVSDIEFETTWNSDWIIDTVTLYIGPQKQEAYIAKIIDLNPRRIIFNPGTENQEFTQALDRTPINYEIACTLVMLSVGTW